MAKLGGSPWAALPDDAMMKTPIVSAWAFLLQHNLGRVVYVNWGYVAPDPSAPYRLSPHLNVTNQSSAFHSPNTPPSLTPRPLERTSETSSNTVPALISSLPSPSRLNEPRQKASSACRPDLSQVRQSHSHRL